MIVVHDPEPVALIVSEIARFDHFVWRCHIDISHAERSTWDFLRPFVWGYDAAVFTLPTFVPRALPHDNVAIITPAIDPLATKNCPLPWQFGRRILASRGIDPTRPLIVQALRLDGRDDPHGVFAVWLDARRHCSIARRGPTMSDSRTRYAASPTVTC